VWAAGDYLGRVISIEVAFNVNTRALQNAVVHRDDGCLFTTIVFDVPSKATAKMLAAPADGAADQTYTANQMKSQQLNTIEDVLALQITAQ
jgi:predicted kinase